AASTGGTSRLHEQNLAEGLQPVWEPLLGGLRNVNLRDYLIHNDSLYAASHQGVFRFDEGRGTWSQYREGLEDGRGSFHMVRDIAHSGSAFIAATATGGAFISTAEPKWTAANNGLRSSDLTLPAPNVLSLAASPGNMLAGVAGEGVFRSTDGGATWKESSQGMANRYAMTLLDLGDRVLAGTFGSGVYRSDNGGASWVDSSDGIRDTSVFDMTASGSRLVVGTSGGIYASDDGGVTWRAVNDGLANLNLRNLGAMGGDKLYAGTYRSAFHVSTDNGATWTPQTSVEFNGTTARAAISADGLELLGTAGRGIYLSKDGGATWTASNTGIAFPFIVALKKIGGRIFAGTDGRGVYVSDDNGASWVDVSTGIAKGYAFGFAEIDGRAFVGTFGSGVYELVGDTWQSRNAGLTDVDVRSLIAVGQTLYAATAENGVFVSTDGGATWNPANDGLEHLRARVLLALNGFLYVGTARDGVYRAKLP
ncbi:MAG: hypothetical protein O3A46_16995, partial [Candidatus Poribacteria bacterium]|nr:hypothetical protein [Candidatus Poribacteria bacterium]